MVARDLAHPARTRRVASGACDGARQGVLPLAGTYWLVGVVGVAGCDTEDTGDFGEAGDEFRDGLCAADP